METIEIKKETLLTESEVHLLPCKIMYTGESDVKSFFSSSIISTERNEKIQDNTSFKTEILETGFRGRPLNGLKIAFSEAMHGLIINANDKENKILVNSFRNIHSWQLDEPDISTRTDTLAKALTWLDIAKIIHAE